MYTNVVRRVDGDPRVKNRSARSSELVANVAKNIVHRVGHGTKISSGTLTRRTVETRYTVHPVRRCVNGVEMFETCTLNITYSPISDSILVTKIELI